MPDSEEVVELLLLKTTHSVSRAAAITAYVTSDAFLASAHREISALCKGNCALFRGGCSSAPQPVVMPGPVPTVDVQ